MVGNMEEVCLMCRAVGKQNKLKVYQINLQEAIKLCEDDACNYPIGLDKVIKRQLNEVTVPSKRRLPNRRHSLSQTKHLGVLPRPQPPSLSSQAPLNVIRPQPVTPSQFIRPRLDLSSLEISPRLKDCSFENNKTHPRSCKISAGLKESITGFVPVENSPKSIVTSSFVNKSSVSGFVKPSKTEEPGRISPELVLAAVSALNSNLQKSTSSLSSSYSVQHSAVINSYEQLVPVVKGSFLHRETESAFSSTDSIDKLIPLSEVTCASSIEVQKTLLSLESEMDIDTSEVTEVIDIHICLDELEKGMSYQETDETSEKMQMLDLRNGSPLNTENIPSSPFIPDRSNQADTNNAQISDAHIKPLGNNNTTDNVISQEIEVETSAGEDSQLLGEGTTYFVVETNKRGRKKQPKIKDGKKSLKCKSDKTSDKLAKNICNDNAADQVTKKNSIEVDKTDKNKLLHKQLPSLDVFKFFPQWQNEEALCWLDVVLCLFVHSRTIRELECQDVDLSKTLLVTLFKAYHQACQLVNKFREKNVKHQIEAASRTRSGRLFSDPDDSDSDDVVESPNTELLKDMSRVNPNAIKTGAGLNCSKDFLSMLNADEQTNYKDAFTILRDIRESIWNKVQPRLQCVKGKNDSPVLAIPLLVKDSIHVEKRFAVTYDFLFSCSSCGYKQVDRDRKVLPTFPSTTETFSMKEPTFLRTCYKCNSPDQKRVMKFNKLPGVLLLHFAEGLPHNNFKKLEFWHNGQKYTVTGFVQYRNDPDHFVTWIRRSKGGKMNITELVSDNNDSCQLDHYVADMRHKKDNRWIEFDDLKSPICRFESKHPEVDASQIHIVMWESCKQVEAEKESSPLIQAKNVQVVSPNGASIRGDNLLKDNQGHFEWSDSLKKTLLDLTEKKQIVKSHSVSRVASTVHCKDPVSKILKTVSQNSQIRSHKNDSQKNDDDRSSEQRREALAKLWKPKPSSVTKINSAKEKRIKKAQNPNKKQEKVNKGIKKCDLYEISSLNACSKQKEIRNNEWKPVNKLQFNEQKYCGLLTNGRKSSDLLFKETSGHYSQTNSRISSNKETPIKYAQMNGRMSAKGETAIKYAQKNGRMSSSRESAIQKNGRKSSSTETVIYYAQKNGSSKTVTVNNDMLFSKKTSVSSGTSTEQFTSIKRSRTKALTNGIDSKNSQKSGQATLALDHGLQNGVNRSDMTLSTNTSSKTKYGGTKAKTTDTWKTNYSAAMNINDETDSIGSCCSSRSSSVASQYSLAPKPFSGFRSKTFSGYPSGRNTKMNEVPASLSLFAKSTSLASGPSKRKASINNLITVKRLKPQLSLTNTPFSSGFNTPCYGSSARSSPMLPQRGKEGDILEDLYSALDLLPPQKEGSIDLSAMESESSGVCLQSMDDFLDQIL